MTKEETKVKIQEALQAFAEGNLTENALALFDTLGYVTDRQAPLDNPAYEGFKEAFIIDRKFDETKAKVSEWQYVDLLFQLSSEEITRQNSLFNTNRVDDKIIESYLFVVVRLSENQYSRTELSGITREINRLFPMPVMVLFKYDDNLTLSVIDRRLHKKDESKDVLEKVTQIKDIHIDNPHRAHIEILYDLSYSSLYNAKKFTNFVELHKAWQDTLDTKELNKRFFNELANWYFWAISVVEFPDDELKDKEVRNATNVIRLITRLMFVWFLKEKNLVPEDLFNLTKLRELLKFTDKNNSTYYKAILQNLFFATLNTEMGRRKFRRNYGSSLNSHYFIHNLFRYETEFYEPQQTLEKYFDPIPFLNGGLFECLDKQIEINNEKRSLRIDGFSDRADNVIKVPDELFFTEGERIIDLSEVYGSAKKNKEKVRGLIDILSRYKFTITENTPIEEEVALDPELLGKVFENLLANYNPETKTTARKQTGSFYTPREIVNYMVDESLIAYLQQKLNDDNTETQLRDLLSYSENPNPFDEQQTEDIIHAIDEIKILDPACGSGAFPMGILHKLVHILHKIDPKNEQWEKRQLEKVDKLISDAETISDTRTRERVIADLSETRKDVEQAFENNELDYGRKLFLIENCIYGVDIQPIAVQIAKLRFFISLIVEQKIVRERANLGIRPLPNLETKFVAANTLIALEKEQAHLFSNPEIDIKKEQLKKTRHDYFEARTPSRKENCRIKDKQLRNEIAELLITEHRLHPTNATKLAAWDPYDQNLSADFFDPEWMFSLNDGFDVVIGNPPYLIIAGSVFQNKFAKFYKLQEGKPDLYRIFIECTFKFLKKFGITSLITPNTFLTIPSAKKIREYIVNNMSLISVVNYDQSVFESASVNSIVYILQNETPDENRFFYAFNLIKDQQIINSKKILINQFKSKLNPKSELNIFSDASIDNLIEKLIRSSITLDKVNNLEISLGLQPYHNTIHSTSQIESRFLHSKTKLKESYIIELGGRDINKYFVSSKKNNYLDFSAELYTKPALTYFEGERLIIREIIGVTLIVGLTNKKLLFNKSCYILKSSNKIYNNKFLLAILNSRVVGFYIRNIGDKSKQILFPRVTMRTLKLLPIPNSDEQKQNQLLSLVDQVVSIKKKEFKANTSALENQIDELVYKLYELTDEEIAIIEGKV